MRVESPSPVVPPRALSGGGGTSWKSLLLWLCLTLSARAGEWVEDFSAEPLGRGWRVFGEASLFAWDATNQNLRVTWDSSRTNSLFLLPLGTVLGQSDDFSLAFDLWLSDIAAGVTPGKPYTFEIAVGLVQRASVTSTNFFRGAGQGVSHGPRNLVEFDYFPPTAVVSATFASTVVSTNNRIYPAHNFPLVFPLGDRVRVELSYTAGNRTLSTRVTRNGVPFGLPPDNSLKDLVLTNAADFRVDSFAVCSYSDARQNPPQFAGSVLAHGVLDNVRLVVPDPPISVLRGGFTNGLWQTRFVARPGWVYAQDRTTDLVTWHTISAWTPGGDGVLSVADTNPPAGPAAYYRIRAERP